MRDLFAIFFWCWCATSIVVLLRRVITKGTLKSSSRATTEIDPKESFEAKLLRGSDSATSAEEGPSELDHDAPIAQPLTGRLTTLAEALEGITLPNGLMPVISHRVDPRNMLFSSSEDPSETIARGLTAEIERLGFSVETVDDETVHAVKEDAELQIRIHRDLERARMCVGSGLVALPESSVIVQMRLR
ncbi:MAG: hypothetical protein P8L46_15710 [Acidimicrobiales bacterium]|nr:hypothetical protein [Acidimicrobiales bacterium]MDG2219486.1 hypothetical protein [Acidimicrobiales bacterium]